MADSHGHHIIPKKTLLRVFFALIGLTILTVVTALGFDLGRLELPVAVAIASSKAALVVMFFMALKYDQGANSLVFTVGAVFVVIFLSFTLLDTAFRGDLPNVDPYTVMERERMEEEQRAREPDPELLRIAPGDVGENGPVETEEDVAPDTDEEGDE